MFFIPVLAAALVAAPVARVLERSAPEYTDEARLARLEGSVLVTVVVGENGTLRDVHVARPIGLGLDGNAVEAVKQWQFAPASEGQKPVIAVAHVDVSFRLLIGRDDWHLSRADFDSPEGVKRPVLIKADYPDAKRSGLAAVTVSFVVDQSGVPAAIHVDKSSDAESAGEVAQFVAFWRFKPASQNGQPVPARCTFDFARGAVTASE